MGDSVPLTKLFAKLQQHLNNDSLSKALVVCKKILAVAPDDAGTLTVQCVCLIWQGKYSDALQVCNLQVPGLALDFEKAYCLYQLNDIGACCALLDRLPENESTRHLRAQVLYRKGDFAKAAEIYHDLVSADAEDPDLVSNYLASCISAGKAEWGLESLAKLSVDCGDNFEFQYNRVCALIATKDFASARRALTKAHDLGTKALVDDGFEADEVESELANVAAQEAFVDGETGRTSESIQKYTQLLKNKPADSVVAAVASNNLFVLRRHRDLFDSYKRTRQPTITPKILEKFPAPHQMAIKFNRTLLLLYMNKGDECKQSIAELEAMYPGNEYPVVFLAALLLQQKKNAKCEEHLTNAIEAASGDVKMKLALALAQVRLSQGNMAGAVSLLESQPESLRHSPGFVATLVALHERTSAMERAESVFLEAVEAARNGMDTDGQADSTSRLVALLMAQGEFYCRHDMFEQAARVFETIVDGQVGPVESSVRAIALSSLVIALSKFDPDAAEQRTSSLPVPDGVDKLDADELEKLALPREVTTAKQRKEAKQQKADSATSQNNDGGAKDSTSSKNRKAPLKRSAQQIEALKRKKAKKKQKFLDALKARNGPEFDPAAHTPDPERWIPRALREKSKKYRKKSGAKMTGAQGAGDLVGRDAAKFDVREAVKKRQEEEAKKTEQRENAHKKNKGKKKGKKGRR